MEDYDQGKDDGFDQQIVKFRTGSGCSDPINHPSCWVISKTQTQTIYSYVQQSDVQQYWDLAQQYALGDKAFASNSGPTYVAHQYLIAGESGHASEVPSAQPWGCGGPASETVDLLAYGQASPPVFSKATGHEVPGPFPCFTYPTIANNLDAAGVSWSYYVEAQNPGGNLNGVCGNPANLSRSGLEEHQVARHENLDRHLERNNSRTYRGSCRRARTPITPVPQSGNKGPRMGGVDRQRGRPKQYWNSSAIIVMWDDWGGWYDHVHPPQYADPQTKAREGLGFRVPLDRHLAVRQTGLHLAQSARNCQHACTSSRNVRLAADLQSALHGKNQYADQRA